MHFEYETIAIITTRYLLLWYLQIYLYISSSPVFKPLDECHYRQSAVYSTDWFQLAVVLWCYLIRVGVKQLFLTADNIST